MSEWETILGNSQKWYTKSVKRDCVLRATASDIVNWSWAIWYFGRQVKEGEATGLWAWLMWSYSKETLGSKPLESWHLWWRIDADGRPFHDRMMMTTSIDIDWEKNIQSDVAEMSSSRDLRTEFGNSHELWRRILAIWGYLFHLYNLCQIYLKITMGISTLATFSAIKYAILSTHLRLFLPALFGSRNSSSRNVSKFPINIILKFVWCYTLIVIIISFLDNWDGGHVDNC